MAITVEETQPVITDRSTRDRRFSLVLLRQAQFWLLCALLFFAPLAFGAVERWSILVVQISAAVLVFLWMSEQLVAGEMRIEANPLYLPMFLFTLLVVAQLAFSISGYAYATFLEFMNYLAFGAVFFVAVHVLRSRENLNRFALFVTVFGFFLALFAIVHDLTSDGRLYWVRVAPKNSWPFGPYVNHSHYAGLMELLVAFPLAIAVRGYVRDNRRILAYFAAILMGLSIFLSLSRGGIAAFVAQLVFLSVCVFAVDYNRRATLAIGGVLVFTIAGLVWIGSEPLVQRASNADGWERETTRGRVVITRDALRMALDRPFLGWGVGVFPVAFPKYRSFFSNRFMNQAHNDYAQLLVETGVAGFGLGIWFLVVLFRRGLKHLRSHSRSSSTLRFAALLGCTGIVVHSLVDFNMHIPANALMFFVLAAITTAGHEMTPAAHAQIN